MRSSKFQAPSTRESSSSKLQGREGVERQSVRAWNIISPHPPSRGGYGGTGPGLLPQPSRERNGATGKERENLRQRVPRICYLMFGASLGVGCWNLVLCPMLF